MALLPGHKRNFETLRQAVLNGDAALMECQRADNGEVVAVVCAVNHCSDAPERAYGFVPIAMLFNDNPYETINPPNPDGGFCAQEDIENHGQ